MIPQNDLGLICTLYKCEPSDIGTNIDVMQIGGETNRNYEVNDGKTHRVVRVPSAAGIVDRAIESRNITVLLTHGGLTHILPTVHVYVYNGRNVIPSTDGQFINAPDGTMVNEYIAGSDISTLILKEDAVQEELVRTLHTFHTSGVRFVNPYDPFLDEIGKYRGRIKRTAEIMAEALQLAGKGVMDEIDLVAAKAEAVLGQDSPVSTHNDLVFGNLRIGQDGLVRLLDFEYAGFNIRGGINYDFGTLLGENLFHPEPIDLLTYQRILEKASKAYGRSFQPEKTRLGALVNVAVTFWWGLDMYVSSQDQKERNYFRDYVGKRIQKAREISSLVKV